MKTTRLMGLALAMAISLVAAGACDTGGSGRRTASPAGTATPDDRETATAAATATGDPEAELEAAAAAYLELAEETNERGEALINRLRGAATLEEARAIWAELAALEEEFTARLDTIEFPDAVEEEVQAVRDMEGELIDLMRRFAAAETDEAYAPLVEEFVQGQPERREVTNRLRAALGLPPVPTATPAA